MPDFGYFYIFPILKGYKVYYTTNPSQPEASWNSQMVDNSELTTISELTPLAIYTIRVQAFTSMGAGPMVSVDDLMIVFNLTYLFLSKVKPCSSEDATR